MSIDDERNMAIKGLSKGAVFYLSKPIRMHDVANLWQHAVSRRPPVPSPEAVHLPPPSLPEAKGDAESAASISKQEKRLTRKGKNVVYECDGTSVNEKPSKTRKPRIVWNAELHERFLTAVNLIGVDRAIPKKIHDFMRVPGLTRQNIASHLQKYRLYLKKVDDANQSIAIALVSPGELTGKSVFGPVPHLALTERQRSIAFASYANKKINTGNDTTLPTYSTVVMARYRYLQRLKNYRSQLSCLETGLTPTFSLASQLPSFNSSPAAQLPITQLQPHPIPENDTLPEMSSPDLFLNTPEWATVQALPDEEDFASGSFTDIFREPGEGNLADATTGLIPESSPSEEHIQGGGMLGRFFKERYCDGNNQEADMEFDIDEYRAENNPIDE